MKLLINSSILILYQIYQPVHTLILKSFMAKKHPKNHHCLGIESKPPRNRGVKTPQRLGLSMFYGVTASSMTFTGVWFGTSKRTSKKRYRRPMAPNLGSNGAIWCSGFFGIRETSWVRPVGPISWRWGTSKNVWVTHIQTSFPTSWKLGCWTACGHWLLILKPNHFFFGGCCNDFE